MHKFILVIGAAALSIAAPAQELLQCVNPDVLNSLVYSGRAEQKLTLSRGMPANADGFRAPAGFSLVGSGVRGLESSSTVVGYRTTLDSRTAFERMLQSLSAEGWKREIVQQPAGAALALPPQPATVATVCRNGDRRSVRVQEAGGVHYATITGFRTSPERACDAPVQQPPGFGNPMAALGAARVSLPQFAFPGTARMVAGRPEAMIGGMNSSAVRIESPDTAASLSRHLSRQLVEQGWKRDAEWNGKLSTGSTWTRKSSDGGPLWGTLEILSPGAGVYDVGFHLTTATP